MKNTLILTSILLSSSVFAFKLDFTPAELEKIKKGEQIERVEEIKNEVFPKVTYAQIIPHTPKENMDAFSDFEDQKNYIPGMMKAKVVKKEGNFTDVSFKLHMPMPASDSEYISRHVIESEGNNYFLTWNLLQSKQLKATKGGMNFEEFEGKTLFTYTSLITPSSSFAWVVKSRVAPDTKKTVDIIIKHLDDVISKK
jgi:ribosome-associated toxin RatA of RatAB toxin-antitoxin module